MIEKDIIEKGISDLLSKKHLYQSITLDLEPTVKIEAERTHAGHSIVSMSGSIPIYPKLSLAQITERLLREANYHHWYIGEDKLVRSKVQFSFPPVRTLCSKCHDVEAFNLFGEESTQIISLGGDGHQVFSFTVQCQRCKSFVIVFLIKRNGPKIQLVGRSEFEEVQVPRFIPKGQSRFYFQAVIAFQCGQVLAALFMLRTLIEQYMRAVTSNDKLRGEDLCAEYAKKWDKISVDKFRRLRRFMAN